MDLFHKMVMISAAYIRSAVTKYLPDSEQKNFMLWILSDENPYQEDYLRMLGVAGSIELEMHLLCTIVRKSELEKLQHYIAILNTYFAFETLSDNIATGLSTSSRGTNETYSLQKEILSVFNSAMIEKINGSHQPTLALLSPIAHLTKQISAYKHSLSPSQMYEFAQEYLKYHSHASMTDLEYSFFPILILNIETCFELLHSLHDHPIYFLLKASLIDRYSSVTNLLIADNNLDYNTLANLGAKSILVAPTLAYCIGGLDTVSHNPLLKKSIENGLLSKSLYSASLLVRLLNDLGTHLLLLNEEELQKFSRVTLASALQQQPISIFDFLSSISKTSSLFYLMTRIRKDIAHGEFNVCLDSFKNPEDLEASLNEFLMSLRFYINLYKKHNTTLLRLHEMLSEYLLDPRITRIILNFVTFHRKMYSREFETKYGDYAITTTHLKPEENT